MLDPQHVNPRHGSTQLGMTDDEIWLWAGSMMNRDGIARASRRQMDPPLHILAGDSRSIWCTGGDGAHMNTMTRRRCRRCLRLARELYEDLNDPALAQYEGTPT